MSLNCTYTKSESTRPEGDARERRNSFPVTTARGDSAELSLRHNGRGLTLGHERWLAEDTPSGHQQQGERNNARKRLC
jgi:hypothetical protein